MYGDVLLGEVDGAVMYIEGKKGATMANEWKERKTVVW